MADPMSIISTVAVAAHAVHKAKDFIDSIKGAPDVVKQLSADLKTLEKPLQDLGLLSHNTQNFDAFANEELSQSLHPALSSCQEASDNIERFLFQYVRPDGVPNRNVWKRFTFGFKEHKVASLQTQLGASKGSLIIAVGYANLWMQTQHSKQTQKIDQGVSQIQRQNRRIQRHFDIETSSVAESEYITIGERSSFKHDVRQWVSQTQSVIEEEQHDERDTTNEHDDTDDEDTLLDSIEETHTGKNSIPHNQQAAEQYAQIRQHLGGMPTIPHVVQSKSRVSKESKPITHIEENGSLSKQIVSQEAFLKHGIRFKDEGGPTVRIFGSIGADSPRRSSTHEDYGAFFVPPDILERSNDKVKITSDAGADADVDLDKSSRVVTASKGEREPVFSPADIDDKSDTSSFFPPWLTPRLRLVEPTPPSSGGATPVLRPKDASDDDIEEPPSIGELPDVPRVTWGDAQTLEYTVFSPHHEHEGPIYS